MILVQKKSLGAIPVVLGLVMVAAILFGQRKEIAADFFREFPPSLFGFSSRNQISAQCVHECANVIARGLIHRTVSAVSGSNFDSLSVHIPFEAMQVLLEDQAAAIERNFLLNPRTVNGQVEYQGDLYPVRLRMKGALSDHWSEVGRMSLKVEVRRGRTIKGFSHFALQRPESRQHPYDPAFQEFAKATGGLAAPHTFVNLKVNGDYWGLWNLEERISSEFLEKQRRRDGLIFNISQGRFWEYVAAVDHPYKDPGYRLRDEHLFAEVYGERRVRRDPLFRRQYSHAINQLLRDGGRGSYDWNAMTRSVVLAFAWGTNHVLLGGNSRYYLNPYTLLLEPITSDQSWPLPIQSGGLVYPYPAPYRKLIENEFFVDRFPGALQAVAGREGLLDPIFGYFHGVFPNDNHSPLDMVHANLRLLESGRSQLVRHLHERLPVERFIYDPGHPKSMAPTEQQLAELHYHVHARHYSNGFMRIYNLLPREVRIVEIRSDVGAIRDGLPVLPARGDVGIMTGWNGHHDASIEVVTEVSGRRVSHTNGLTLLNENEGSNPLLHPTPDHHLPEFFEKTADGYTVQPGAWQVSGPLMINGTLRLGKGTSLAFGPDAFLVVRGALHAAGTPADPVVLRGSDGAWKGLYVLEADTPSIWTHVKVSDTAALESGALALTGGVTFYRADLRARDVGFHSASAEDALNVVESTVDLQRIRIRGAVSDAIDLDYCSGTVIDLDLRDVGGDGLDLSGTDLAVTRLRAGNIRDKALSVGEASRVELFGMEANQVGVGIATKDGSRTLGSQISILDAKLHAAMSYQKKDYYDKPEMILQDVSHDGPDAFARQHGSGLTVNGVPVPETALDVEALYQSSVMVKR